MQIKTSLTSINIFISKSVSTIPIYHLLYRQFPNHQLRNRQLLNRQLRIHQLHHHAILTATTAHKPTTQAI
jgi:hypothetical protein